MHYRWPRHNTLPKPLPPLLPLPFAVCPPRRKDEEERRAKIAAMEEAQLAAEEKYKDKADEAEQKTKKLKKLWKKFQEVNTEVEDMYKEFQREKVRQALGHELGTGTWRQGVPPASWAFTNVGVLPELSACRPACDGGAPFTCLQLKTSALGSPSTFLWPP